MQDAQSIEGLNALKKIPLWKLDKQITIAIIESKTAECFKQDKRIFTLKDLQLLQIFNEVVPLDPSCLGPIFACVQYNYKIRCNLQGLKRLLETNFCKENNYFYLKLYIPIVITSINWLLCQCIKNYFYTDYIANLLAKINEQKKIFNQTAHEYNSWLADNPKYLDILQLPYVSEKKLGSEPIISGKVDCIIHSPLLCQSLLSQISYCYSLYCIHDKSIHDKNFNFFCDFPYGQFSSVILGVVICWLSDKYPSYWVNNSYLSIVLANAISIITALYGIYFYKTISPYFKKIHQDSIHCAPEDLNKLFKRTDIEILN